MFPAVENMPTPLSPVTEDVFETADNSERPYKIFVGHNLGYRTFLLSIPMHEFYAISEVANDPVRDGENITQRKLDMSHAQKLAVYLLKGLVTAAINRKQIKKEAVHEGFIRVQEKLGRQPYLSMQPIVANIRDFDPARPGVRAERMATAEGETSCFKVHFSQKHVLWVVDGQHRRKAMALVFDFLNHIRANATYPKKGGLYPNETTDVLLDEVQVWEECFNVARGYCTVAVELHLGLEAEEERQLFHDLNNLAKKVEASLALQFDNSNPINLFIKERLIQELQMQVVEKDVTDWRKDPGALPRKDLVAVNALLFLNKTNIGGATPPMVTPKLEVAYRFWETVASIPGFGEEGAKQKTVVAQPVIQKALAKLAYAFAFSNRKPDNAEELLERLFEGMTGEIDFTHANPMWRYYELSEEERAKHGLKGLKDYLPNEDEGANRDIGKFQEGCMRFGAKHNDIYPIIGDMIRWKLGLPNRQSS